MSRKEFSEVGYRQKRRRILKEVESLNKNLESDATTTTYNTDESYIDSQQSFDDIHLCHDVKKITISDSNISNNIYSQSVEDTEETVLLSTASSTSTQSFLLENNTENFKIKLRDWILQYNISHSAVNNLLTILKLLDTLKDLPSDVRTLMRTPRQTSANILNINGGEFVHFGLENGIKKSVQKYYKSPPEKIKINVNIDGLPLTKSSSSQFWPILGCIVDDFFAQPFIISVHHGFEKPACSNTFLSSFVDEAKIVLANGVTFDDKTCTKVELNAVICDAPAKAYISGIKSHTGYFGCSKCVQEGEFIHNRMTFPEINSELRTDSSFKERKQIEHHKYTPILESVIGMVSQQPLDYMHLVCIGVTKRLIQFMVHGRKDVRLKQIELEKVNNQLEILRCSITKEFVRKPRSIFDIDRWKASELRQFLLYTGPVVLKDILLQDKYDHFIALSCAIRILANKELHINLNEYANSLLRWFVEQYPVLYGQEYVTYNIHNLVHLADDVKQFGPLDKFSAFVFESFMQNIKKKLKLSSKPLHQLFNRIEEENQQPVQYKSIITEPVIQPNNIIFSTFQLTNKCFENCFQDIIGNYFEISNIELKNNNFVITAKKYLKTSSLFTYPFDSSQLGIVQVETINLDTNSVEIELKSIKSKVLKIHSYEKNSFVLIPLIHCDRIKE